MLEEDTLWKYVWWTWHLSQLKKYYHRYKSIRHPHENMLLILKDTLDLSKKKCAHIPANSHSCTFLHCCSFIQFMVAFSGKIAFQEITEDFLQENVSAESALTMLKTAGLILDVLLKPVSMIWSLTLIKSVPTVSLILVMMGKGREIFFVSTS